MLLACTPWTAAQAADHHLLLNYSPSIDSMTWSTETMTCLHDKFGAASKASSLKVGMAIIHTPKDRLAEHEMTSIKISNQDKLKREFRIQCLTMDGQACKTAPCSVSNAAQRSASSMWRRPNSLFSTRQSWPMIV